MSVVNDSFNKHSQARSIDQASAPKPENNRYVHLTQKMYLPYERTRRYMWCDKTFINIYMTHISICFKK